MGKVMKRASKLRVQEALAQLHKGGALNEVVAALESFSDLARLSFVLEVRSGAEKSSEQIATLETGVVFEGTAGLISPKEMKALQEGGKSGKAAVLSKIRAAEKSAVKRRRTLFFRSPLNVVKERK